MFLILDRNKIVTYIVSMLAIIFLFLFSNVMVKVQENNVTVISNDVVQNKNEYNSN